MKNNERAPIDSDLLRSFLVIADQGNLTLAASHLNRTQSAISVQLRKLEQRLGVALFARTSRGMSLTVAGDRLLPKARVIVEQVKQASALFEKPLTGSIRVGLPDDYDEAVLERVLSGFGRSHHGVRVIATSGCTSGYPSAINSGALDIAVYSNPQNVEGETLDIEQAVWAAKRSTPIRQNQPIPLAILDRNCWWKDLPTTVLDATGRDYVIAFRSSSFAGIQAAIRAGFAIGILPASCVGHDLSVLSASDRFPELPKSRRSILIAKGANRDLTNAMAQAIKDARAGIVKN